MLSSSFTLKRNLSDYLSAPTDFTDRGQRRGRGIPDFFLLIQDTGVPWKTLFSVGGFQKCLVVKRKKRSTKRVGSGADLATFQQNVVYQIMFLSFVFPFSCPGVAWKMTRHKCHLKRRSSIIL